MGRPNQFGNSCSSGCRSHWERTEQSKDISKPSYSNYCKVLKEKVMLCINFLVVSTLCSAPWKFKEQGPVGPPYEKGLVKSIKHFCRSCHHANIDVHMVWDHTSTSRISKCRLTHDFRGSHTTGTTQNRMLDVKMYYKCFLHVIRCHLFYNHTFMVRLPDAKSCMTMGLIDVMADIL